MPEPWVRFEDEQLLVVDKPAGVTTHRADVHAQDGMYDWVQRRRPGIALALLHRLDKATSGLLALGKTAAANRSLNAQFEGRTVAKRYELLVGRDARRPDAWHGDQPVVSGGGASPRPAATDFERRAVGVTLERWDAVPHTGRTHQVRVHAAQAGLPILGDGEHGGAPAARLFLHAASLRLDHPSGGPLALTADRPASFDRVLEGLDPASPSAAALVAHEARALLFDPAVTDAYLWADRHHDGFAGIRLERLGDVGLVLDYREGAEPLPPDWLAAWHDTVDLRAIYHQRRPRGGGGGPAARASGRADPRFEVMEEGRCFVVDLGASETSSGLFLDQRETRRRLAGTDRSAATVLNAFGHTGSLSVAAAVAGATTVTLDLSKRYLEWTRDNLRANGLDPADHDFIYGDALEWMGRLARKGRRFDVVLVDPPSSSTAGGRGGRRWVVERDLHTLVARGAELCAPGGTLFVSTNLRRMRWPQFLGQLTDGLAAAGRVATVETQTLPLDHRSGPGDPPYLKAAWLTLD